MTHLLGISPVAADLQRWIAKAARSECTVLIQGETGTGKGVAARAIHEASRRAGRPFIVVDCGAIPDSLVESEFFGHERGAFTGADRQKRGKFEAADSGSIFLDEIGELSLSSQTRLLHVLQDREIERLGGEGKRIPIDVRVIAATNRNLEQKVADGSFREDLYFRLNVFPIRTPSLRERRDDIPPLANHFVIRFATQVERTVTGVAAEAIELLRMHPWPGNIRQLENVIQRAVAFGETEEVCAGDLPTDFLLAGATRANSQVQNFHKAMDETARQLCIAAFKASDGNCREAAHLLGLHRNSIYRLIRRHNLEFLLNP